MASSGRPRAFGSDQPTGSGRLGGRYRVGTVAYQLALPLSLSGVHEVFHVSMLRKYTPDQNHVVDWGELIIDTDGTFEGGLVRIMDSWDQVL